MGQPEHAPLLGAPDVLGELLPPHPYGGGHTVCIRVTPEVVVELSVDLALALGRLRWRLPVRLLRVREEPTAADLAGERLMAES